MAATTLGGRRFGRLLVLDQAKSTPAGAARWKCRCDCGVTKIIPARALVRGRSRSCGCLHREVAAAQMTVHGFARRGNRHPLYMTWVSMWNRCTVRTHKFFRHYGGRGITVCDRWRDFRNFLVDMGERPPGTSLDRYPDNDGNYEPANVRWATRVQQRANRRDSSRRKAI